ncbi:SDR family oxidoreductase [Methylobacterium sp. WL30]|uniref:SDR family oxidoreductase n=1 Tax=unclassified Methylobacterium TaxID=2615210 RepID=UPI0011CA0834|nr:MULTISPECIES: SDR family oxidoreductase [unclassified Methylobacterium]TXN40174.1 SDR family oxidoreductase [Methylobacterium sp. WL93]TXN48999.1 SDR family oxidoreductase [Methylobacterium sp. WL119]TXN66398.1 SDR family oxidoreductase [Methylobacterium sp. WL30]
MTGKTVLITGANRSIGYETARQLGRSGYRVWLGSRDAARGTQAAEWLREEGHDVRSLPLDVTSEDSVRNAVLAIEKEHGVLDVLINNAGVLGAPPVKPSEQRIDDIRAVYETNVFGSIRVTQAFLPLLKDSEDASVIMVSSGLGSLGWLSDPANPFHGINVLGYNSSKTALNAVTVSFAKEFAPLGIRVNAADPGYTATDFNGHTGYRTVEQAAAGIVWLADTDKAGPTGSFFFEQEVVPW